MNNNNVKYYKNSFYVIYIYDFYLIHLHFLKTGRVESTLKKHIMTHCRRILSIFVLGLFSLGLSAQETGKADIFSDEFQGSWTASKTTYNKSEFVAAHKSYEFGTILKVMLDGGEKAINVRVVDRGPFKFGYVVTLSRAAANELGLKEGDERDVVIMVAREQGLATVAPTTTTAPQPTTTIIPPSQTSSTVITQQPAEQPKVVYTAPTTTVVRPAQEFVSKGETPNIETGTTTTTTTVVTPAANTTTINTSTAIPSSTIGFGLQVGSFVDYNNAMIEMSALQNKNINNLLLNAVTDKAGRTVYKLIIGPFSDRIEVEQYKSLEPNKYNSKAFIVDLSTMK